MVVCTSFSTKEPHIVGDILIHYNRRRGWYKGQTPPVILHRIYRYINFDHNPGLEPRASISVPHVAQPIPV
jgi:hypothetical protein